MAQIIIPAQNGTYNGTGDDDTFVVGDVSGTEGHSAFIYGGGGTDTIDVDVSAVPSWGSRFDVNVYGAGLLDIYSTIHTEGGSLNVFADGYHQGSPIAYDVERLVLKTGALVSDLDPDDTGDQVSVYFSGPQTSYPESTYVPNSITIDAGIGLGVDKLQLILGQGGTADHSLTFIVTENIDGSSAVESDWGSYANFETYYVNNETAGSSHIVTGSGADTLRGGGGDDVLQGNGGDDEIYGGGGQDTAVFSGNFADYDVTDNQVADLRSGSPDGTDSLSGVEFAQFDDGTLDLLTGVFTPSNQPPVTSIVQNLIYFENVEGGGIARIATTDPDSSAPFTYGLSDDRFEVGTTFVGAQQWTVVKLKDGVSLDYETTPPFQITLTTTNSLGASSTKAIDILVNNLNENPTVANSIPDSTVAEDTPWSFTVPEGTFADQDAGTVLTFSAKLADGNDLPLWLSFNTATRTFSGTPPQDFNGQLAIRVTATDNGTGLLWVSSDFTLTVEPVNDAPAFTVALPRPLLFENVAGGAIGTLLVTDPDSPGSFTYTVEDNRFEVQEVFVNSTLGTRPVLKLKDGVSLNYETTLPFQVAVMVTDNQGASSTINVDVLVNNLNDAPQSTGIDGQTSSEDAAWTFTVPEGTFADQDAGTVLTFSAKLADGNDLPLWLSFNTATRTFSAHPRKTLMDSWLSESQPPTMAQGCCRCRPTLR